MSMISENIDVINVSQKRLTESVRLLNSNNYKLRF
jgi:hypothetical protein